MYNELLLVRIIKRKEIVMVIDFKELLREAMVISITRWINSNTSVARDVKEKE